MRIRTFSVVPIKIDLGPEAVETGGMNLADRGLGHVLFNRYGAFALAELQAAKPLRLTAGVSYDYDGDTGKAPCFPSRPGAATLRVRYLEGALRRGLRVGRSRSAVPDGHLPRARRPGCPCECPESEPQIGTREERRSHYEHRFGDIAAATVGGFYNRDTGLQQIVPGGPVTVDGRPFPLSVSFRNLGLVWSAGGDVGAMISPVHWLQLSASYQLLFGEETLPVAAGGEKTFDLAKIPHHKVLAGLTVRPLPNLVADVRLRWLSDVQTRPSNSEFQGRMMPGYYDLNLNLRAEDLVPGLDAHLLIQNLTDHRYYQFGPIGESGTTLPRTPQPPFRFLLGLSYRWDTQPGATGNSSGENRGASLQRMSTVLRG